MRCEANLPEVSSGKFHYSHRQISKTSKVSTCGRASASACTLGTEGPGYVRPDGRRCQRNAGLCDRPSYHVAHQLQGAFRNHRDPSRPAPRQREQGRARASRRWAFTLRTVRAHRQPRGPQPYQQLLHYVELRIPRAARRRPVSLSQRVTVFLAPGDMQRTRAFVARYPIPGEVVKPKVTDLQQGHLVGPQARKRSDHYQKPCQMRCRRLRPPSEQPPSSAPLPRFPEIPSLRAEVLDNARRRSLTALPFIGSCRWPKLLVTGAAR